MLKSCAYCGRIHDSKIDCGKKPSSERKLTKVDKFRGLQVWKNKRDEIKKRDKYVCQICIRGLHNPQRKFETENLSVHHAIPIESNFDKRLDNDNLITLCNKHHEDAEKGLIKYKEIKVIIDEQELQQ
ncbi:MAG: HNH endonuclease [Bacilli bacterium]